MLHKRHCKNLHNGDYLVPGKRGVHLEIKFMIKIYVSWVLEVSYEVKILDHTITSLGLKMDALRKVNV